MSRHRAQPQPPWWVGALRFNVNLWALAALLVSQPHVIHVVAR